MKVNPDRARRYILRTLTAPPREYVFTAREKEAAARWEAAFQRGEEEPGVEASAVYQWRSAVERYAQAKGFRPELVTWERAMDGSTIIRWKEDRP